MSDPIARLFEDHGFAVRVYGKDNRLWFVAKDVCDCLKIKNSRDAISNLDEDEKDAVGITDTIGRTQETAIISESGLYTLAFKSRKAEAKKFQKWITSEVIPSIRASGGYVLGTTEEEMIRNAQRAVDWKRAREESKKKLTVMTDALKARCEKLGIVADSFLYAREADMLNSIILDCTSKEWKEKMNLPKNAAIRDTMEEDRLRKYAELEQIDATCIKMGMSFEERLERLRTYFDEYITNI